jgi:hypothetical protein
MFEERTKYEGQHRLHPRLDFVRSESKASSASLAINLWILFISSKYSYGYNELTVGMAGMGMG